MRDRGAAEIRKRYLTGRQPQIVARVSPHYGRLSGVLCGHGDVMLWEGVIGGFTKHVKLQELETT